VRVPGKTFFVGEYLALSGGPSIVMNSGPCFEFSWTETSGDSSHPFHKESPAGRFLDRRLLDSASASKTGYRFEAKDPYHGVGGLGASTAEFLGAWIFDRSLKDPSLIEPGTVVEKLDDHRQSVVPKWASERWGGNRFRDVLDDYRGTYLESETPGSGADLVSQITGGLSVWDARTDEMRRFQWPFPDLTFTLLFTGHKLKTHEHLARAKKLSDVTVDDMRFWVEEAIQSLALEDADRLTASVRGFGKVLSDIGLVADTTARFLEGLADLSGVRAAKGCGAMGSDTLLILHDTLASDQVNQFRDQNGLKEAATASDLWTQGLTVDRS